MRRRLWWFWLLVMLTIRCGGDPPKPPLQADVFIVPPLAIDVYPLFAMRPATFRVRVSAIPHEDNRSLCWWYDGPEYKRSCLSLDGTMSARTYTRYWDIRSPGVYHAEADLLRIGFGKERHFRAIQDFTVLGEW